MLDLDDKVVYSRRETVTVQDHTCSGIEQLLKSSFCNGGSSPQDMIDRAR